MCWGPGLKKRSRSVYAWGRNSGKTSVWSQAVFRLKKSTVWRQIGQVKKGARNVIDLTGSIFTSYLPMYSRQNLYRLSFNFYDLITLWDNNVQSLHFRIVWTTWFELCFSCGKFLTRSYKPTLGSAQIPAKHEEWLAGEKASLILIEKKCLKGF